MNGTMISLIVVGLIGAGMATSLVLKQNKIDNLLKEMGVQQSLVAQCQTANQSLEINVMKMKANLDKAKEEKLEQTKRVEELVEVRQKEKEEFELNRIRLQEELQDAESTNCSISPVRDDFVRLYEQTRANSSTARPN